MVYYQVVIFLQILCFSMLRSTCIEKQVPNEGSAKLFLFFVMRTHSILNFMRFVAYQLDYSPKLMILCNRVGQQKFAHHFDVACHPLDVLLFGLSRQSDRRVLLQLQSHSYIS